MSGDKRPICTWMERSQKKFFKLQVKLFYKSLLIEQNKPWEGKDIYEDSFTPLFDLLVGMVSI